MEAILLEEEVFLHIHFEKIITILVQKRRDNLELNEEIQMFLDKVFS